jgi:3-deoxy-D-manno-octulosonate 8-phosphate phosphatase (KDO 8-P phosphatase)
MALRRTSKKASRPVSALRKALSHIRLFATDVDGVLTDAGMYYGESGDEWKKFNTRDGMGIKLLQRAGIVTAIVTQERTKLVARRAEKLAMPELHQGVMDKLSCLREMAARHGFALGQVAYIGDDINDLEALRAVGFSAAPADSMPVVAAAVDYVCQKKGGEGAVREIIEMILDAQGSKFEVRGSKNGVQGSKFEVPGSGKRS